MRGSGSVSIWGLAWLVMTTACATVPDYLRDADPVNADLTINVVIENPVGSNEKWEVRHDGRLVQEQAGGAPVQISYLPWPVNGGMIPRTLLSAELGGDGEPCDVLVLGPAVQRGSLVRAVPIGLLRVLDRLERDDKILAVMSDTPLAEVTDIAELDARFPGVETILESWYTNSWPGGGIQVQGFGSRAAARRLIGECAAEFDALASDQAIPEWGER